MIFRVTINDRRGCALLDNIDFVDSYFIKSMKPKLDIFNL
jgi:hypothetical protein